MRRVSQPFRKPFHRFPQQSFSLLVEGAHRARRPVQHHSHPTQLCRHPSVLNLFGHVDHRPLHQRRRRFVQHLAARSVFHPRFHHSAILT